MTAVDRRTMADLRCPTCWGSHGCDLPAGHTGDHACIEGDAEPYTGPVNWDTACMIWSQDDPNSFPCRDST